MSTRVQAVLAVALTAALIAVGVLAVAGGDAVHHLPAFGPRAVARGVGADPVVRGRRTGRLISR